MTAEREYKALFLGAGPQMQCGVGQFTRLLYDAIEKLDSGSSTALTLTQTDGSITEIWRATKNTAVLEKWVKDLEERARKLS